MENDSIKLSGISALMPINAVKEIKFLIIVNPSTQNPLINSKSNTETSRKQQSSLSINAKVNCQVFNPLVDSQTKEEKKIMTRKLQLLLNDMKDNKARARCLFTSFLMLFKTSKNHSCQYLSGHRSGLTL